METFLESNFFRYNWLLWEDEQAAMAECQNEDPDYPVSPEPTDAEIEDMYVQSVCPASEIPF